MRLFEVIGSEADVKSALKNRERSAGTTRNLRRKGARADQRIKEIFGKAPVERLGKGYFAVTFTDDPDQPGTVRKVVAGSDHDISYSGGRTIEDVKDDGYIQFLIAAAKGGKLDENPYFPKIYSIVVKELDKGMVVYAVDMERLTPLKNLRLPELKAIADRVFGEKMADELFAEFKTPKEAREELASHFDDILYGTADLKYIKDPHLKEALKIVKRLGKKTTIDLHDENIMVRRGPYGNQLVITDPVV